MKQYLKFLFFWILLVALTACGGGSSGSSSTSTPLGGNPSTNPLSVGSVVITKTALVINETTNVTATYKSLTGAPYAGVTVNFSTTLGSIAATAVTDASGKATASLNAGAASGQGSVTSSALINNVLSTSTASFTVQLPALKLSALTVPLLPLSYGASTSIEISILDSNGNLYTAQDVDVSFVSTQSALGKASINSPIRSVNGKAVTTYTAISNTGNDTITASIAGSSQQAIVQVNPLSTNAIQFISALPAQIGLKGVNNGFPELSTVTFKVIDSAGQPKPNVSVDFSLDTSVGGITLSGITNSTLTTGTGSTNNSGLVTVNVNSGTIATSVRVTATVTGTTIMTQSDQLVIASGLPAQDTMSISLKDFNSESWSIDGVTVSVTARLADHFKNPVKGTAVTFTTSGGSIDPSCITDATGACSVIWRSQNPRPLAFSAVSNPNGPPRSGQVMILAHAIGEEDFLDSNGNGLAGGSCAAILDGTGLSPVQTCGEFKDWSEAFLDQNWSDIRESGETFIDYNQDGKFNGPNGFYTGSLQDISSVGSPRAKHIFSNTKMVMSSGQAGIISLSGSSVIGRNATESRILSIADINGNTMPSGTVIGLAGINGVTVAPASITVPQNIGGTLQYGILIGNAAIAAGGGGLSVTVTSPGGLISSASFPISWP